MPGFVGLALLVAVWSLGGMWVAAQRLVGDVRRVQGVAGVLSPPHPVVENFLLVGSDSRAGGDPNTGTTGDVSGRRSDTIMVLRIERATGSAALLSIPRDLFIRTPAHTGRINGAFNEGAAVLVAAVQTALQVPVHHYVEIDFSGFEGLVQSLGGVEVCFDAPTRDLNTGLDIPQPGCRELDGTMSLAYARSRHYERLLDGAWVEDPTSDLGRSARQRDFVDRTLRTALDTVTAQPFSAGAVIAAILDSVAVDGSLDLLSAASTLRTAAAAGLVAYALPVVPLTIDGAAVLELADGAQSVLAWFRGEGPAPG